MHFGMGLTFARSSGLAGLLGPYPGADWAADFERGLYFGGGQAQAIGGVVSNVPAGEPTSSGMLVDGADAPSVVQGRGPELADLSLFDKRPSTDGTVTFADGILHFVNAGAGLSTAVSQEITGLTVGKTYEFVTSVRWVSGAAVLSQLRTASGGGGSGLVTSVSTSSPTFATQSVQWVATQTSVHLSVNASVGSVFEVQSVSFKGVLPFTGYAAGPQTFSFDFETPVSATKRGIASLIVDSNNRVDVYLSAAGALTLESVVAGVSEGSVSIAGVDDGSRHTGLVYFDPTGALKVAVDGGTADTDTGITMPTGFANLSLGTLTGSNQLNGIIKKAALTSSDAFTAWA